MPHRRDPDCRRRPGADRGQGGHLDAVHPSRAGSRGDQPAEEIVHRGTGSGDPDVDPPARVPHVTGKSQVTGEAIYEGAEADSLHDSLHHHMGTPLLAGGLLADVHPSTMTAADHPAKGRRSRSGKEDAARARSVSGVHGPGSCSSAARLAYVRARSLGAQPPTSRARNTGRPRFAMNQSLVSAATISSAPGSAKRCVASGTTASSVSPGTACRAY